MTTFQDDDQFVCKECFSSFSSVYKFKQSFQSSADPRSLSKIRNVCDFLSESEEPVVIINHHSCLSLVPESKVELVKNFVRLVDSLQETSETPKSQPSTPLHRTTTIPISSPLSGRFVSSPSETQTSSSFNRSSIHTRSPMNNRFNLAQSNVVITEAVSRTTTSGIRKRRLSSETPEPLPKAARMSIKVTTSPRNRQSIRGRQSVKQNSSPEQEENDETERKLTVKEEKLLREKIQGSKVAPRTYECSYCNEDCANYKEIRAHILSHHFN